MWTSKDNIRRVVCNARKHVAVMSKDQLDAKIWFDKTDEHARANKKKDALWCLCVMSCILFEDELSHKKTRNDIISQIHHQFQAY